MLLVAAWLENQRLINGASPFYQHSSKQLSLNQPTTCMYKRKIAHEGDTPKQRKLVATLENTAVASKNTAGIMRAERPNVHPSKQRES